MLHLWGNQCVAACSNREPGALRLSSPSMTTIATTGEATVLVYVQIYTGKVFDISIREGLTPKAREDADDAGETH